jgi:hypothetical protein
LVYDWLFIQFLFNQGILNIVARLIFGFLADRRYLTPVNLNTLCAILATLSLWSYSYLNTFYGQIGFAIAFATGIGKIKYFVAILFLYQLKFKYLNFIVIIFKPEQTA